MSVKVPVFQMFGATPIILSILGVIYYRHRDEIPAVITQQHERFGLETPYYLTYGILILPVIFYNVVGCALQSGNMVKNINPYFPRLVGFLAGLFVAFNNSCADVVNNSTSKNQ